MRKLGCCASENFGACLEDVLKIEREAGFESFFTLYESKRQVEKAAELSAKIGIELENIHAPFAGINSIWQEGDAGEAMLEGLIDCVHSCAENGISLTVVHLSSGENSPCVNDIGRARYDRLIEEAVKNNIIVAFENQRKLANLAFVMELYRDIPQVGFCWDTGHEYCFTGGKEFMPLFGDRLAALHIHDNVTLPNEDNHMIPFDASINFNRVAEHIRNSNYEGTLMLEISKGKYPHLTISEFYERAYTAAVKLREMVDI